MNKDLKNKLQEAIERKNNDITSYSWRLQNGNEIKLIDCTETELNKYYKHCTDMLYNKSLYNPGKYTIKENIKKTYDNCNTELFIRFLIKECNLETIKTNRDLLDFINEFRKVNEVNITDSISVMFTNVPAIFEKITVGKLMDGCFDKLDVVSKKMISDKFILSQGIWLTDKEKEELTEYDENGKIRNRMEVIKERLLINPSIILRIDPNGLSYSQFRAMVQLPSLPKISSLPSVTLETLRDKVLLLLDNDLNYHIEKWTNLKECIEKIAEHKNIKLN